MTDVVALFGRGALFIAPFREFQLQRLLADKPLERSNPGFVLLEQIGSRGILIEVAGLGPLHPDPDQVSADVMALGEPMKGLAAKKLLSDLALEFDAVCAVLGHRLSSFESPASRSIHCCRLSRPRGPLQSASKIARRNTT